MDHQKDDNTFDNNDSLPLLHSATYCTYTINCMNYNNCKQTNNSYNMEGIFDKGNY